MGIDRWTPAGAALGALGTHWTAVPGTHRHPDRRGGPAPAALILPTVNARGGNDADVTEAVRWLDVAGGPERAIGTFARSGLVRPPLVSHLEPMISMHAEVRLALEMALHEEEERRLLAGELSVLRWAWRYEERLAAIADRLGLSEELENQLDRLRKGVSATAG